MNTNQSVRGFTLVEIAIGIVIIGLLFGGILKGQEMISAARIKAVIKNISTIQQAHQTFRGKYDFYAGDFATALLNIPNCTAANFCANGNGNMIIGASTVDYPNNDQSAATGLPQLETTMFWKHLAIADMIGDINTDSNPVTPAWGRTHPSCSGCGGYHIMHIATSATPGNPPLGHYMLIRGMPTGNPNPTTPGSGAMKPLWAFEIDTKIDDGNANAGFVRAPQAGGLCADVNGNYNTSNGTADCIVLVKM